MFNKYGKTRIFYEEELSDYLKKRMQMVVSSINHEDDAYILNVNEEDYIKYKVSEVEIGTFEIHVDDIYASSSEKMIPAEYFPNTFSVRQGQSYKKNVIKFHIPYSGDSKLLRCTPSSRIMWSMDVEITGKEFCFEIINFSDNANAIVKEKDSNIDGIMKQCSNLKVEINQFNENLEDTIRNAFKLRKDRILANSGILASLGVPIKKISAPKTFAVPDVNKKKKVIVIKPDVKQIGYTPEPSLDESVYQEILKLVHDVGKEFERLPSLYADKEEEHLRTIF